MTTSMTVLILIIIMIRLRLRTPRLVPANAVAAATEDHALLSVLQVQEEGKLVTSVTKHIKKHSSLYARSSMQVTSQTRHSCSRSRLTRGLPNTSDLEHGRIATCKTRRSSSMWHRQSHSEAKHDSQGCAHSTSQDQEVQQAKWISLILQDSSMSMAWRRCITDNPDVMAAFNYNRNRDGKPCRVCD